MAEGILSDLVDGILRKLGSDSLQESASVWGIKGELQRLQGALTTINLQLLDAEEQQTKSNLVRDFLNKLKEVVYDVEDLLDEFVGEALHNKNKSMKNQVRNFFTSSNPHVLRLKLRRGIKELRERVDQISKDMMKFNFEYGLGNIREMEETLFKIMDLRRSSDPFHETGVIGRDEEREELVKLLAGGDIENNISIIPIVGMGGLGKTTLAHLVYKDKRVIEMFQLRIWVCVSECFIVRDIVKMIVKSVTQKTCDALDLGRLLTRLRENLDEKKYLLVLDDVWNVDVREWNQLKTLLQCGAMGSKIIVTTRFASVASIMGTTSPLYMQELSEDYCWQLLCSMTFEQGEVGNHRDLEAIGRKIVMKCKGLPLAVKTIGGLLRHKRKEIDDWLSLLNNDIWERDDYIGNGGILSALKLSYKNLPSYIKQLANSLCLRHYANKIGCYVCRGNSRGKMWLCEQVVCVTESTLLKVTKMKTP